MDVLTEQELAIPGSKARGVIPEALILRVASVAVLLVVWQFLSLLLSARYVPGPLLMFSAVAENITSGAILHHFTVTMLRMLVSFALAMALGVVSGTLMGLYRRCEQTLDLWVMVGLTIPSLCYIIVSFLWLGLSTIARRCWLSPGQPFLLSPSTSGRA